MRFSKEDLWWGVTIILFILNLLLIWSHFKFLSLVKEIGAQEPVCSIEEAWKIPSEAKCKEFYIVKVGNQLIISK